MSEPLIAFENLSVHRGDLRALGPLDLELRSGQFLGVVGPNGAGKSTLLLTAAGLCAPSQGEAVFAGTRMRADSQEFRRAVRGRVGFLFQHHDFIPDLPFSVEDVVLFGRLPHRGPGRAYDESDREAAAVALEKLGLRNLRRRLYRDLSGGERRKAHLARLLAQDPVLLLLDEPGAGLDLDWQERLTQLVETVCTARGKAVVMVVHDVDQLPASCDRVLLLKEGRPLAIGAPSEVFTPATLSELYGCRMEVVRRGGRFHAFSLGVEASA